MKKIKSLFFSIVLILNISDSCFAQITANFIGLPTSGCSPLTVNFTDQSTGNPSAWNWTFGNGNTSTIQHPSATYSLPGTYTVTLVASNGTFSDTKTRTAYITVYSNPVASFTLTPDTACVGSTISFSSTSSPGTGGPITRWLWTFGDGALDSTAGGSTTHSYGFAQTFPVNLLVRDIHGCNSTISHSVVALNGPTANFTANPVSSCSAPVTVNFTNSTTGNPTGYVWDFGDPSSGASNTSTVFSPSHTFNSTGSYVVKLTALTPACQSIHLFTVQVLQTAAAFTASDTAICLGSSVTFTNNTLPTNATYAWNFGDPASAPNNTSTLPNPSHLFSLTPGIHTVTLVSTANGCPSTITHTINVRPHPSPSITAIPSSGCQAPFTVSFNVTTPGIATWQWNFNDPSSGTGNTSTIQNPTHTYNTGGTYLPTVSVTDSFGCTGSALFNNILIQPPNAQFIPASPDSGCVPLTEVFASTSTSVDPIVQYTWIFGDGTAPVVTSSSAPQSHTYTTVGIWDVTLIVQTQGGCIDTIVKPNWVRAGTQPNADFSWIPDTVCFGEDVQFTSLTPQPVTGWTWSFGDGASSSGSPTTSHIYNIDTATIVPFTVRLIAFYNGCPDTMVHEHIITVLLPVPDFVPQHSCATPYTFTFLNTSRGATGYRWDFGDTTAIDTSANPVHTYTHRGNFNVTLTDTSSTTGCSYFKTIPVRVTDPKAHFTPSVVSGCFPLTVHFTDSSQDNAPGLYPNQWNFGDPSSGSLNTSFLQNPNHLFNHPGFYSVRLSVFDIYGCQNDSTYLIHVLGPTAGFNATPRFGCAPLSVLFSDNSLTEGSPINQYTWSFGNGNAITTVDSIYHSYSVPNVYTVTLTVRDTNLCTSTLVQTAYISVTLPSPSLAFGDSIVCPGELITDTITSGNFIALPIKYHIDYGDFTSDSAVSNLQTQLFSHSYSSNGVYPVTVTVTDGNGCDSIISRNITVLKPTAAFSVTSSFDCTNQAPYNTPVATVFVNFFDQSTGLTSSGNLWSWDFNNSSHAHIQNPSGILYIIPGYYSPQLIVTNGAGCADTIRPDSLVNVPGPRGNYTFFPLNGCRPLTVNFNASTTGGGFSYTWDFGDGNVSSQVPDTVISHTYIHDGVFHPYFYIDYVLPDSSTCKSVGVNPTNDTVVTVHTDISVDIDSSFITLPEGGDATVHAIVFDTTASGGPPYSYSWTPAYDIISYGETATISVNNLADQAYYYCTVTNSEGCEATDSVLVIIIHCDAHSIIPNVFTPDGDQLNDTYHIDNLCPGSRFHFTIYNRWGTIIYESNDVRFHWDGKTTGGSDASDGTYYYVCTTGKSELHGFLQLIRKR